MNLPEAFVKRIKERELACDDVNAFLVSFDEPPVKAFHLNTAVISKESFEACAYGRESLFFEEIEASDCAYYHKAEHIGHHPFFHAGILYSEDPSAFAVLSGLEIREGERILDLCAAPGGKTSVLARNADKCGASILANETDRGRYKILISNMERMGYHSVSVSNLMPADLALMYPSYFDTVVVDAPCSGEGMFRKYKDSVNEWSPENVSFCSMRQKEILESACKCLKPGGRLIYSTCTYATEEDEDIVRFLTDTQKMTPMDPPGFIKKYASEEKVNGISTFKLFPHRFKGEGQFAAYLKKDGECFTDKLIHHPAAEDKSLKHLSTGQLKTLTEALGTLPDEIKGRLFFKGNNIYYLPERYIFPSKGAASESGFLMGGMIKGRFMPSHYFFKICGRYLKTYLELSPDGPELAAYLHGEELKEGGALKAVTDGGAFGVVKVLGVPVGGFKYAGGRIKNHYPKGLRNNKL